MYFSSIYYGIETNFNQDISVGTHKRNKYEFGQASKFNLPNNGKYVSWIIKISVVDSKLKSGMFNGAISFTLTQS